ncbi:MAG TPA: glycosyltransferase [Acidocella sp.]|uniref:glycosyltransferase n=1 Tax=Acidocella sp. TaxID=50710 RepID=UPI002C7DD2EC|nr:glycosyltransferase [Acidocella sp.]HVE21458.1 glycosyltransferase [Acidocella sp.]
MNAIAGPVAAWARASGTDGLRWLKRAARLAPDDPRIALDLALKCLEAAPREAEEALAALAVIHDVAAIWLGLALARQRGGDAAGAATALSVLLERHCVTPAPGFTALADRIARQAGYGGWQGMTENGAMLRRGGGTMLGAPDLKILHRVEGVVEVTKAGLAGWAARPAALARPALFLHDATGRKQPIRLGAKLQADATAPFLRRYRFRLDSDSLRALAPPFRISGPDGAPLAGSPADPAVLSLPPVAAKTRGTPPGATPAKRPLCVVVPVYRGLQETQTCLNALFGAVSRRTKIIVVDDASPEPALAAWLDECAAARRIVLLRHDVNAGFPAAANAGIEAAGECDVLLLNSDTLVPPGAVAALRRVAYAQADTGSVTPFSNAAAILSYPRPGGGHPPPDLAETIRLNRLARRANHAGSVEIPTGIGFCLYLRHDALRAAGLFRAELFAQGYGEENDWCLRARQAGFTHRAATGAYVTHIGGVSFGAEAAGLQRRNLRLLERLYPGYRRLVTAHIEVDPLRPARARLDAQRLAATQNGRESVLVITHNHGGGVARQEAAERQSWRARGYRPLLLRPQLPEQPDRTPYPWPAMLSDADEDETNLIFSLPRQKPDLLRLLRRLHVTKIVLHHTLGHDDSVRDLAAALGLKQTIIIHDYASFCPRVNLLAPTAGDAAPRYCGEPDDEGCAACCASDPENVAIALPAPALRARNEKAFTAAADLIAPSADAARRIVRHFPRARPQVTPWENLRLPAPRPPARGFRRIAVIGGIGPAKGLHVLRACAQDAAARRLGLEFTVIGCSADDSALLAAGVFVTGPYREGEAAALLAEHQPDLAFLPSIWPETWCFALSEAWAAGLYAVVFDLGAQAERMRATGRGLCLPLGLPPPRINDVLCRWQPMEKKAGAF